MPHIAVARLVLSGPAEPVGPSGPAPAPRARLAWAVAGIAAIAAFSLAALMLRPRPAPPRPSVVRYELRSPEGTTRFGHTASNRGTQPAAPHFAVSPDGRTLVFVAVTGETPQLWLQSLDSTTARLLPGTDDASFPFWSPDGRTVAFFANGALAKISPGDSRPTTICAAEAGEGGTWGPQGDIFFSPSSNGAIWRVAATGGTPVQVTTPSDGERHRWPFALSSGGNLLYLAVSRDGRGAARMRSLTTGVEVEVLETVTRVMAASGHLLFQRGGQLWGQPFDEQTGSVRGEAQRLADDVAWFGSNSRAGFHVSESGVLVHRAGSGGQQVTRLVWRARNGVELGTVGDSDRYSRVALSPAGDRLITQIGGNGGRTDALSDLWMIDLARGVRTRFTADRGYETGPLWSRDGSQVVYGISDFVGGDSTLWMRGSGGATEPRQIGTLKTGAPTSWSPDGLSVVANSTAGGVDVSLVPLSGERPTPLLSSQFAESNAVFSPDGTLLAYQSTEASSPEVYVQPWPFTGEKWRLSTGGGRQPQWNPRGGELFFVTPRNDLMAVAVTGSARSRTFSAPTRLFGDAVYEPGFTTPTSYYAPSPDGQRFVTIVSTSTAENNQVSPIVVTINWPSLLK